MIHHGDCLEILPTLPAESIDSIVTDPPYGLSFMGKNWDSFREGDIAMRRNPQMDAVNAGASRQGGRQRACADYQKRQARDMIAFQEAMNAVFTEALRVAKPGTHLLAFGGTRTFHRLTCAIEDAGWEIRDCIMWVYGSGFPKSHDVSKAIDREAGAEREAISINPTFRPNTRDNGTYGFRDRRTESHITAPATPAAQKWQGWGTALKPAWEPIIVARKPLKGTVAQNVQEHGTGAVNVDGCRIGAESTIRPIGGKQTHRTAYNVFSHDSAKRMIGGSDSGRWPANLIHDGSDEVAALFNTPDDPLAARRNGHNGPVVAADPSKSAARFFYCAKASKADRDGSTHPTMKPTDLMRYLCRLVTQPGGTVLDPFCGSGSTGKAATLEGFEFIGIEREAEYVEIARARIAHARGDMPLLEAVR